MQKEMSLWKRLLPILAVMVLALGLAGCGDQSSPSESQGGATESSADQGEMVGGWEWNADPAGSYLTDKEKAAFDEAYKTSKIEELGWTFNPVAHVATKKAEGDVRDVYLVQGACGDETEWDFITVKKLEGEDQEFVLNQITPGDLEPEDEPDELDAEEGWKFLPVSTAKPVMMPEEAQVAYDKVAGDLAGATPLGLVATQLVSGMNYLYLVQITPEGADEPTLALATVYNDLEGNASITETGYLEYAEYFDLF
ncbi:MAG: hypothetical protein Q4C36_09125 [Coriobacteriia bacterium]|nr:hypothetical protein [Coriobacteriia bacterium]